MRAGTWPKTSTSASTSTTRVPAAIRMTASPAAARRRSASRARCRAPVSVHWRTARAAPLPLHELLDADVPVQRRPAGCGAHVVPDAASRRVRGHRRQRDYTFNQSSLGSQILRINYQEQNTDIKQSRIDGKFKFEGGSTFGFGVETRAMEAHQLASGSNLTMGDWGVGDAGHVPDMVALLTPFSLTGAFDDFTPVGAPTGGWKGNANVLWLSGRPRPRLHQLDGSYRSGRSAALQPGLQHRQHDRGRHPGRVRAVGAQVRRRHHAVEPGGRCTLRSRRMSTSTNLQLVPTVAAVAGRQRLPGRCVPPYTDAGRRRSAATRTSCRTSTSTSV